MLSWAGRWISWSQHPDGDLGAFVFRRTFAMPSRGPLRVKVSADQRYRLFLNGHLVSEGPQRGDLMHWFYETVDLAPHLVDGENVLEAVVWSYGRYAPMAQTGYRLAFLLDGGGLSTPDGWKVARLTGREFEMLHSEVGPFYIDIGPGETVDLRALGTGEWRDPNVVVHALERGEWAGDSPWNLIPRSIPAMRNEPFRGRALVVDRTTNERKPFDSLMLHPGEKVLLDFGELLCAYPEFRFEGTAGSIVKVTYGEGLFDKDGNKSDRNDVRGKHVQGYQDRFIVGSPPKGGSPAAGNAESSDPAGGDRVSTLWWRTWRYVQLESDAPVRLASFGAVETGYPYAVESSFEADDPWVAKIWDVGVRTAKRCAGETYFDCPYYEQLQYAGDTRIQALIHYYLSRDRALPRNAVEQFAWSALPEGLTQSRYPSRVTQVIPPFSLFWILMLRDQMLFDGRTARDLDVSAQRAGRVLENFPQPDGKEPFWFFFDWVDGWSMGEPPMPVRRSGTNALKILAEAATDHIRSQGRSEWWKAMLDENLNGPLSSTERDWRDVVKQTEKQREPNGLLSQPGAEHVEALWAQLHPMIGLDPPEWPTEALAKAGAAKTTLYFSYYRHLASRPDDYLAELGPWKQMIENGLTTFAEKEDPVRSDCHAWSAHPLLGFFQLVAGVTSIAPAWKRARIEPKPGKLRWFGAQIAHPDGDLRVSFKDGKLEVDSPVPYDLVWKGQRQERPAGRGSY